MSSPFTEYRPWLHRVAVSTAALALVPIVIGALVTTLRAGMAFLDWPNSDGHNIFLYPWLMSAGDKFIEHGHRLAGILIGIGAIALTVVLWTWESRAWVRWIGLGALLCVIVQGLLGGMRVLQNDQSFAMIHGVFAACVFSLFGAVALFTSRGWIESQPEGVPIDVSHLKPFVLVVPVAVFGQYLLGGMIRHLGFGLHEHFGLAFLVLLLALFVAAKCYGVHVPVIRKSAWLLVFAVGLQVMLGLATWVLKYGFPTVGFVAVHDSWQQVTSRTVHTVFGMFVLLTAVLLCLRVFRIDYLVRSRCFTPDSPGGTPALGGLK
ncbi:MAG: COX15/CtaA family protein [Planctomycetota bacterium]|nr:COX15/CtaA family protein [Planctomycetota bacterium]